MLVPWRVRFSLCVVLSERAIPAWANTLSWQIAIGKIVCKYLLAHSYSSGRAACFDWNHKKCILIVFATISQANWTSSRCKCFLKESMFQGWTVAKGQLCKRGKSIWGLGSIANTHLRRFQMVFLERAFCLIISILALAPAFRDLWISTVCMQSHNANGQSEINLL